MNNPTSGNKTLELFLTFSVKEGKQEQFEKVREELITNTAEQDPGALIFNTYKNSDGTTWCLYERYVDEAAFIRHKEILAQTLTTWFEVVEIKQFFAFGDISEEGSKNFKGSGYEVFSPVRKMER
jgi:quinol monooxygenase YgiN